MNSKRKTFEAETLEKTLEAVRTTKSRRRNQQIGLMVSVVLFGVAIWTFQLPKNEPGAFAEQNPMPVVSEGERPVIILINSTEESGSSATISTFSTNDSTAVVNRIGDRELHKLLAGKPHGIIQSKDGQKYFWAQSEDL